MKFSINKVLVIGLGLIGGSLAKALKQRRYCQHVIGYDRNPAELEAGLALGVIDEAAPDLRAAVAAADLVVLAVPVKATDRVLADIVPVLRAHTLLTDVGSTKGNVVAAAEAAFGTLPATFVPGHPIAGSEKSGVAAADAQLFERHKVILTPTPASSAEATLVIARMWQAVGAQVLQMEVGRHDQVLAATSHLPHLLAFSLVDTLAAEAANTDIFRYAAGGFRDFTRIAASDPTMWHDICLTNGDAILAQLDRFSAGVEKLRHAISSADSQAMLGIFTRAKASRDHFSRILSSSAYAQHPHSGPVDYRAQPGAALSGPVRLPGDKSISHRAIMLGSLAEGITSIEGFLESEDSLATLQAFRDMGVVIEGPHQGAVKIYGVGLHGLQPPPGALYLGRSGMSMRLLCGVLAGQAFDTELTGDVSLSRWSMEQVVLPLRQMGARIDTADGGLPPLRIRGAQSLHGIEHLLPVPSAQVKSALLLAGLYATGSTAVTEPAASRDHTERMLQGLGCTLDHATGRVAVQAGGRLRASRIDVPGDMSLAAFFIVGAAITPGSELLLQRVGINPTRTGLIEILRLMGADIRFEQERCAGGEPVADVRVCYRPLSAIEVPAVLLARASDELPLLMVAAACAQGATWIRGVGELRHDMDRLLKMLVTGLGALGIEALVGADSVCIRGGAIGGGALNAGGDYRVAMAFAALSQRASGEIHISECACLEAAFPEFVTLACRAGFRIGKEGG
ncbi:bifunctional prephenate dehydrogenase/3-phosphoshikimate 1-carboxyvinyltransferase [Marinobacterium rhizophilum]|uniref:3-phosphoshikimate 1-carboxyvinyltransferase n=1 Tax=Marinobacterium rhizophilum TaxID=420402 RepID=A0ABY5HQH3_9GAMM|nr:bifunctional prephenate dehydrogenase/3-phosphoshikimate 1-carboxyvinyltransferase [Marinobacterium rhizophilum]UTW14141.1 bifunctional prephenate dehydrogenase/3-phosphoshikimate 1-carboxyvinyltransferase [Marinobacterium rhizophilum]